MLISLFPKGFTCAGCSTTSWKTVCGSCKAMLQWNRKFIPSPIAEIEALSPLLYSYSRTQALIRQFKEYGGNDLKRVLFKMPVSLKDRLLEMHFLAIVPIPQDLHRNYRRGHRSAVETAKFFSRELDVPLLPLLSLKQNRAKRITGMNKFDRECSESPFEINTHLERCPVFDLLREKMSRGKPVHILLVDDLITSGSTLAKAGDTLKEFYPDLKIWGGSIGFRPHRVIH